MLCAEQRKSVRPSSTQLVINRKIICFKRKKTLKVFLTWSRHVLLITSQVLKRFLLNKDFPICFILNEKELHKCMNGPPDHFQCLNCEILEVVDFNYFFF